MSVSSKQKWIFGLVGACSLLACIGTDDTTSAAAEDIGNGAVASTGYELSAGEQSLALGVARWTVEGDVFRGFDKDSKPAVELQLDPRSSTVQSVYPESGLRGLRDHGLDTFTPRSAALFDALRADLQEYASQAASLHPDQAMTPIASTHWVFVDCYRQHIDCTAVGQNLLFDPSGIVENYSCDNVFPNFCTRDYPIQLSIQLSN